MLELAIMCTQRIPMNAIYDMNKIHKQSQLLLSSHLNIWTKHFEADTAVEVKSIRIEAKANSLKCEKFIYFIDRNNKLISLIASPNFLFVLVNMAGLRFIKLSRRKAVT